MQQMTSRLLRRGATNSPGPICGRWPRCRAAWGERTGSHEASRVADGMHRWKASRSDTDSKSNIDRILIQPVHRRVVTTAKEAGAAVSDESIAAELVGRISPQPSRQVEPFEDRDQHVGCSPIVRRAKPVYHGREPIWVGTVRGQLATSDFQKSLRRFPAGVQETGCRGGTSPAALSDRPSMPVRRERPDEFSESKSNEFQTVSGRLEVAEVVPANRRRCRRPVFAAAAAFEHGSDSRQHIAHAIPATAGVGIARRAPSIQFAAPRIFESCCGSLTERRTSASASREMASNH